MGQKENYNGCESPGRGSPEFNKRLKSQYGDFMTAERAGRGGGGGGAGIWKMWKSNPATSFRAGPCSEVTKGWWCKVTALAAQLLDWTLQSARSPRASALKENGPAGGNQLCRLISLGRAARPAKRGWKPFPWGLLLWASQDHHQLS